MIFPCALVMHQLLTTGIQKGVHENVMQPLVTAYKQFVEQGVSGFMRPKEVQYNDAHQSPLLSMHHP